jgi:hypothetical protein
MGAPAPTKILGPLAICLVSGPFSFLGTPLFSWFGVYGYEAISQVMRSALPVPQSHPFAKAIVSAIPSRARRMLSHVTQLTPGPARLVRFHVNEMWC